MASRSHHWQGRSATSLAPDLLRRRRVFRLRFRSQVRWPDVAAGRSISTVQPPLRPCRGRPIRGVRDPHDHRLRRPDLLGKPTWWLPRRRDRALPTSKSTGKPLSTAWPRHGHHRRSMPTAQGEPAGPVQEPDKAAPQSRPSRTGSSGYDISRHRVSSGTHGFGARRDFEMLSRRFSLLCVVLSALARKAGGCGDGGLRRVRTVVLRKRSDVPAPTDPPARRAVVGNRYPAGTGASPGAGPVTRVRWALCGRSLARAGCGTDIPLAAWVSRQLLVDRRVQVCRGDCMVFRHTMRRSASARVAELDDDVVERRGQPRVGEQHMQRVVMVLQAV
jgi:hypothetical protein